MATATESTFNFEEMTDWSGCAIVALLINSDGGTNSKGSATREAIWASNARGELFGVYGAIELAEFALNKYAEELPSGLKSAIIEAGKTGEDQEFPQDARWATGIGRACAAQL